MGLCVPACVFIICVLLLATTIAAMMGWLNGFGPGDIKAGVHKLRDALDGGYCDPRYSSCGTGRPFLTYAAPPPF
ncbi:hypothetical protein V6N13_013342 [Hibiscus sabdariffa]|uniref:Uncharacterized protein n=2 Tax=Hibiscus sabdariffa TaxID=183260 RepID=A0ABR2SHU1_9ROSI